MRLPLAAYPGINRFVLDWLEGRGAARDFLPRGEAARPVRKVAAEVLDALVRDNERWGIDARRAADDLRDPATRLFIAGQQVGFAGGPLYTLSKIATLIRMKRDAESRGERAVAMFWLATEDHDWDEVAQLSVPREFLAADAARDLQQDLLTIRARRPEDERRMVGNIPIPDSLTHDLAASLGIVRHAWIREGITFRDSFAELIAEVFGSEVVLADALLPELRRAGAPLFELLSNRMPEAQRALFERCRAIENAGYSPQITARDGEQFTVFYTIDDHGTRQPSLDVSKVPAERVSTSAITRPLLQDFVLQPDAFVGGPAEVAYYAQLTALHELAGVRLPRVALRGHALVAPGAVMRSIDKYGIAPEELFASPDTILASRETARVAEVERIAASARESLLAEIARIRELALPADHSLARSINRSIGHLEYHFSKLTERSVRAIARKDRERHAAVKRVAATLRPDGHVQERIAGWYPYYAHYGEALVRDMIEAIEPDAATFSIVSG